MTQTGLTQHDTPDALYDTHPPPRHTRAHDTPDALYNTHPPPRHARAHTHTQTHTQTHTHTHPNDDTDVGEMHSLGQLVANVVGPGSALVG